MTELIDGVEVSKELELGTAFDIADGPLVVSSTPVGNPVEDDVAGGVELSSADPVVVQVLVSVYVVDLDTMTLVLLEHCHPGWRFGGVHRGPVRRVYSSGRSSSANEILSNASVTYGCWPGIHLAEDILRGGGVERGGFQRADINI